MRFLRLLGTETDDVDNVDPAVFAAGGHGYSARIIADVPFYVEIGVDAVATEASCYVNEFDPIYVNVGPDEDVSILGSDTGVVFVTEVLASS